MKDTIKLALILCAYTAVACVGLAFVHGVTAPVIALAAEKEAFDIFAEFFPDADSFENIASEVASGDDRISFERVYRAEKDGQTEGVLVQATGATYETSTLLSAFSTDGKLIRYRVTATSDTAGLGTKIGESPFIDQFEGKSIGDEFAVGNDVQAISGATISSRGAAAILRASAKAAEAYFNGGVL